MLIFWNSKFRNQNSDFLIFQQRNSKKKFDRNLWNQKQNRNTASDGGPRNWSQKLEFPTKKATNDRSGSALGGMTHQLQKYGCVGLTNAAAMSNAKTNSYFCQFSRNGNTTKGMFHRFDKKCVNAC